MKRLLLSFFLSFFLTVGMAGDFTMNQNCKNALEQILALNFNSARELISNEKKLNPENSATGYLDHYIDFLKAFISEEPADFAALKKNLDIRINQIEKTDATSPWKNMVKGEMILQTAVVKLKYREYITAGYLLRKSYKLLEENHKNHPSFIPNLKYLGFFHAVIGAVPDNYLWLSHLAGMKGTISEGSKELNQLVTFSEKNEEYYYLKNEAYFLKIFIATHFEKDTINALHTLDKIKELNCTKGALHTFLEVNTLIAAGRQKEALAVLKKSDFSKDAFPLYYLNYQEGILKLNNLDFEASKDFSKYISGFKGNSFIKSAYHKLAWIAILKNDTKGFQSNFEKVKLSGNDFTDEDKQAQKDAVAGQLPNITLLRSRLLFDGGNFNEALSELASGSESGFSSTREQLEFTYRLARIFDKKNQKEKAITYYTKTFENGKLQPYYFSANAALNIGIIYEEKDNKTLAIEWYKKCLSLRNHEYQNSIDQKAEGGLDRLKDRKKETRQHN